ADQKHATSRVGLKMFDPFFAVSGLAVEVLVGDVSLVEIAADDRQVTRELREDEGLVPLFEQVREVQPENIQFGAGVVDVLFVEQGRVAGRLSQPQKGL